MFRETRDFCNNITNISVKFKKFTLCRILNILYHSSKDKIPFLSFWVFLSGLLVRLSCFCNKKITFWKDNITKWGKRAKLWHLIKCGPSILNFEVINCNAKSKGEINLQNYHNHLNFTMKYTVFVANIDFIWFFTLKWLAFYYY